MHGGFGGRVGDAVVGDDAYGSEDSYDNNDDEEFDYGETTRCVSG